MLLSHVNGPAATPSGRGGGFTVWAMSQAVPLLMRKAAGRVLAWVWKAEPELLVVMAQVQAATPQLRIARASMPIEYNDTEENRGTYTSDLGTHFVTATAVCSDRERFGTVIGAVDELARGIRIVDDLTVRESATVLRIDPA
jgi:hypothetical protein